MLAAARAAGRIVMENRMFVHHGQHAALLHLTGPLDVAGATRHTDPGTTWRSAGQPCCGMRPASRST